MMRGLRDGYEAECRARRRWRREEAEVRMVSGVWCEEGEETGREEVRRQVRMGGVSWWSCVGGFRIAKFKRRQGTHVGLDEERWIL